VKPELGERGEGSSEFSLAIGKNAEQNHQRVRCIRVAMWRKRGEGDREELRRMNRNILERTPLQTNINTKTVFNQQKIGGIKRRIKAKGEKGQIIERFT